MGSPGGSRSVLGIYGERLGGLLAGPGVVSGVPWGRSGYVETFVVFLILSFWDFRVQILLPASRVTPKS